MTIRLLKLSVNSLDRSNGRTLRPSVRPHNPLEPRRDPGKPKLTLGLGGQIPSRPDFGDGAASRQRNQAAIFLVLNKINMQYR